MRSVIPSSKPSSPQPDDSRLCNYYAPDGDPSPARPPRSFYAPPAPKGHAIAFTDACPISPGGRDFRRRHTPASNHRRPTPSSGATPSPSRRATPGNHPASRTVVFAAVVAPAPPTAAFTFSPRIPFPARPWLHGRHTGNSTAWGWGSLSLREARRLVPSHPTPVTHAVTYV